MKVVKSIFISIFIVISFVAFAQKNNLQNTANALKFKELDKAKKAIDLASEHEETKNDKKMWYYRGKTYYAINDDREKFKDLDPEAAEKAYLSFINCLKASVPFKINHSIIILIQSYELTCFNNSIANGNFET